MHRLPSIDRRLCRETFEQRFTVSRMTGDYERIYERLVAARAGGHAPRLPSYAPSIAVVEAS